MDGLPLDEPRPARVDPNDAELADLAERLPSLRERAGCPSGDDRAILAMSRPRPHTACPNPYVREWIETLQGRTPDKRADPGPFASDTTAGKSSLVYKA